MSSIVHLVVVFMSLASCGGGIKLTMQRSFPITHIGTNLPQIREAGRLRHGRMLKGVVPFPVEGYADPGLLGLYYTQVQLGSPPKTFNVQIDTGSDILWVACANCIGFKRSEWKGMTILGDLVLKDKIVVYDIANQRIGWANYDCSKQVKVLETNNTHGSGLKRNTSSALRDLYLWVASVVVLLLELCL